MSTSYYAITLIGCRVKWDKVYQTKKTRTCFLSSVKSVKSIDKCTLEQSGLDYSKFKACPYCASPIWKDEEIRIDDYNEYLLDNTHPEKTKIDLVVQEASDHQSDWWVGHIVSQVDEENIAKRAYESDLNLEVWRNRLERALSQFNMWDKNTYGIYTILIAR